ncbi:MAG: hypothetical protein ACXV8U_19855, partial [Methylobacter sp.]
MHQPNALRSDADRTKRLEAEHQSNNAFDGSLVTKSVQYLPVKSASFASQVRRGNYKNSNIAKIAGKFGRSFLAKLANF